MSNWEQVQIEELSEEESVEQPAVEQPAEELPTVEQPAEEEPAGEQPLDERLVDEEIAGEPPVGERPEEQPVGEGPIGKPVANDLTYTGEAQALVNGEGDLLYSLDSETYGEEIPTAVNAGEYTVYNKAADSDEPQSITVIVAKADVEFTPPVAAVE